LRLSNSQRAFLLQATETYKASIHLGKDYLASRGLSVEEVQRFHLGVVEHPLPGHEGYTGRLAIPYVTPSGVVDIRFRTMSGGDPKYMGMPGAKTTMFNSQAVLTADGYICVTEGEIDCITVVAKTNHPSVGIPGANNWKPYYSKILDDFDIWEYIKDNPRLIGIPLSDNKGLDILNALRDIWELKTVEAKNSGLKVLAEVMLAAAEGKGNQIVEEVLVQEAMIDIDDNLRVVLDEGQ